MAWTNIDNALVSVGALPFATTIQALRDNPIAIANGDAGAPKVQNVALAPIFVGAMAAPTAGSTYIIKRIQQAALAVSGTTAVQVATCNCIIPGVIRVYAEHRRIIGTIQSNVYKNNVLVTTWATSSAGFVGNIVDVSVALGDQIEIRSFMTTSGSGENGQIQNMFIYSGTYTAAVA